jgi:CTP synthase (UTP-ammonia lyase)
MTKKLIVLGEHNPAWETHRFTTASIEHSRRALNVTLEVEWHSTEVLASRMFEDASGFWIATGTPYKSLNNALEVIRYARTRNVPCLATCQGFQHLMIEYAQAFLGIAQPAHEEYSPDAENPFISQLSCSLKGQELNINLKDGTLASRIYNATQTTERYYCSYGISPEFASRITDGAIRISGVDANGEIRIVEYPGHPFMIGTLFVPQARSREATPHPLITAFIRALAVAQ